MEDCDGQMEDSRIRMRRTKLPKNKEDNVKANMKELIEIQEELKKAKESATQSWLDSKPLIDELEKQQAELATAKNRTSMSNVIISELQSQLQATNSDIKSKMVEELEVTKIANEISDELERTRQELKAIKVEIEEERKIRANLKQVLKTRRQTLQTLQLTLRAIRVESEAFGASLAKAKKLLSISESENNTLKLSQEEYFLLTQRAKDEAALAEWRVSVAIEQKLAADASRNLALSRLQDLCSNESKPQRRGMGEEHVASEEEERMRKSKPGGVVGPRARAEEAGRSNRRGPQQMRRSNRNRKERLVKTKRRLSVFSKIKSFLARSFKKLFG